MFILLMFSPPIILYFYNDINHIILKLIEIIKWFNELGFWFLEYDSQGIELNLELLGLGLLFF